MPPKTKSRNKQKEDGKKRKVISPIGDDISINSTGSTSEQRDNGETGSSSLSSRQNNNKNIDVSKQSKKQRNKKHKTQPGHFNFDSETLNDMMNSNTTKSTSMNPNSTFTQPFSGQFTQSNPVQSPPYQFSQQYMMPEQTSTPAFHPAFNQPSQASPTPPWAISIIEDIKSIKGKMDKIDSIEKTVNSMSAKLYDFEIKMKNMESRIAEVEGTSSFLSGKYDDSSQQLKLAKDNMTMLQDKFSTLNATMETVSSRHEELKSRVLENEFRNMRENLIFYGFREDQNSDSIMPENEQKVCENLVKVFINDTLKIDSSDIQFDRAHRLGNSRAKKPRPIIVKFHNYTQRERVRQAALAIKEDLGKSNFGVGAQIPKEWREARKALNPVYKSEKQKGKKVKFVGEKLFISDVEYKSSAQTTNKT